MFYATRFQIIQHFIYNSKRGGNPIYCSDRHSYYIESFISIKWWSVQVENLKLKLWHDLKLSLNNLLLCLQVIFGYKQPTMIIQQSLSLIFSWQMTQPKTGSKFTSATISTRRVDRGQRGHFDDTITLTDFSQVAIS